MYLPPWLQQQQRGGGAGPASMFSVLSPGPSRGPTPQGGGAMQGANIPGNPGTGRGGPFNVVPGGGDPFKIPGMPEPTSSQVDMGKPPGVGGPFIYGAPDAQGRMTYFASDDKRIGPRAASNIGASAGLVGAPQLMSPTPAQIFAARFARANYQPPTHDPVMSEMLGGGRMLGGGARPRGRG
jgi:hypothetical protein